MYELAPFKRPTRIEKAPPIDSLDDIYANVIFGVEIDWPHFRRIALEKDPDKPDSEAARGATSVSTEIYLIKVRGRLAATKNATAAERMDRLNATVTRPVRPAQEPRNEVQSLQRSNNERSESNKSTAHVVAEPLYAREDVKVTDQHDVDEESTFYSQSKKIADTLSLAATSTSVTGTDSRDNAAGMVGRLIQDAIAADSPTFEEGLSQSTSDAFTDYPGLAGLRLPAMDSVLRLLAFAKRSPQSYFSEFPHADEDDFAELCQRLYFPTQPFTLFAWINVNCGLYYLFRDLNKADYDLLHLTRSQVSDTVATCSDNIDRAMTSLKFCVSPSLEAVSALLSAGVVNMERARGYLGWKFVSAAARMSIDLGYHRLPPGYGDRRRSQKRRLFWHIYSIERSLAFNFSVPHPDGPTRVDSGQARPSGKNISLS
ncbi:MAG: hypothetical protein Q9227_005045 [Pyrenula ochraceoflavens]